MNKSKFSLADVLSVLSAISYGFICFLSLDFLSVGEVEKSILVAVVITLILGGFALGAALFKRTARNFKIHIICEWIFLCLFVVMAVCTLMWPFSHFFAVTAQKEDIQQTLKSNVSQAEKLYEAYEKYSKNRLNIYENRLNSVVAGKKNAPAEYEKYGFENGVGDDKQLKHKMFELKNQLFPSNYEDVKNANLDWIKKSESIIDGWKPIGLVNVARDLENNLKSWQNDLVQASQGRMDGEEAEDFKCSISFDDATNMMIKSTKPTLGSVLCGIGLCFLMIVSYLVSKRHPCYPGWRLLLGFERKDNPVDHVL